VRLFNWLISDGQAAKLEKAEAALRQEDARAVACRVGDASGTPVWRVVIQVRGPTCDFDNVSRIHLASKKPPHVSDVLLHFKEKPNDFEFVTFLPNTRKVAKKALKSGA
jgi:hypothetical protein